MNEQRRTKSTKRNDRNLTNELYPHLDNASNKYSDVINCFINNFETAKHYSIIDNYIFLKRFRPEIEDIKLY